MKKLIMGCMSLAMAGMMMVPICAEDSNNSVSVSYREPNTYNVVIPANTKIDLSSTENVSTSAFVSATNVNIEPNKSIIVKITDGIGDDGIMTLKRTGDPDGSQAEVTTKLSLRDNGEGIKNETVVAQFEGNSDEAVTGTGTLHFSKVASNNNPIKAGSYTGKLTFLISVPDKN